MLEQADSHRDAGRPSSDRDDRAMVIGASVAGLLAARMPVEQVRVSSSAVLPARTYQPPTEGCRSRLVL